MNEQDTKLYNYLKTLINASPTITEKQAYTGKSTYSITRLETVLTKDRYKGNQSATKILTMLNKLKPKGDMINTYYLIKCISNTLTET